MKFKGNKYYSTYGTILTKKFLKIQYVKKNKSSFDIAKDLKCHPSTVIRNLHKHKIRIKTRKESYKGKIFPLLKNGRYKGKDGYVRIFVPDYDKNRVSRYVTEHKLIIEKHIGRKLSKKERIHHNDLNKSNNKLSNLFLCNNRSKHSKIHRQLEQIAGELVKLKVLKFKNGEYYINTNKIQ